MSDREQAAREFAHSMGAVLRRYEITGNRIFIGIEPELEVPTADASLHKHLSFVGRVAEAVGEMELLGIEWRGPSCCAITIGGSEKVAGDPSWAAMLAATAARRAAK